MRIQHLMTRDCVIARVDCTAAEVAATMRDRDVGMVPVMTSTGVLAGVVTDRDLALRCVGENRSAATPVCTILSTQAVSCHTGDSAADAAALMATHQVRRLPVLDPAGRLVGIVSLADILPYLNGHSLSDTFRAVSSPRESTPQRLAAAS